VSELNPCPSCNRHVRVADPVCPFCSEPQAERPPRAEAPFGRPRLNRAAIFAAGAALAGMSACSTTGNPPDAGVGGATGAGTGGAGASGGAGGAGGAGGSGGSTTPDGGPVPIYSAVFPPPKPPKSRNG
jgi:hypothetical protein